MHCIGKFRNKLIYLYLGIMKLRKFVHALLYRILQCQRFPFIPPASDIPSFLRARRRSSTHPRRAANWKKMVDDLYANGLEDANKAMTEFLAGKIIEK